MVDVEGFISRWKPSGGSERANFQQFAVELTQLLGVPAPNPATADAPADDYRFERPVTFIHTGTQSRVSLTCTDVAASSWKRSKVQGEWPRTKTS